MDHRVSVVICAYTMRRWDQIVRAVDSVRAQTLPVSQIVLVVDHNPELLERVRAEIPDVAAIASEDPKGLSAARNTGIARATGSIVAFLDDDARAEPDWIEHLVAPFAASDVAGTGGRATPDWIAERPKWFPSEFSWVVGCSYEGLPTVATPVRNVIGANMAFRREVFDEVGGFNPNMGRVGTHPVGCEETELCIRIRQKWPDRKVIYQPAAEVMHEVASERTSPGYFIRRCYAEGLSKARVVELTGADQGLASERSHALRVLPRGVAHGISDSIVRRQAAGLGRATAIIAGLAATTTGFAVGTARRRLLDDRLDAPRSQQSFDPILMSEAELTSPLPAIHPGDTPGTAHYRRVQVMVRLGGRPIGIVRMELPQSGLRPESLAQYIRDELGDSLRLHLAPLGAELPDVLPVGGFQLPIATARREGNPPAISVIVATRDRPDALRRCLRSLGALDYPDYEVIVVDNAPTTSASKQVVADFSESEPTIRYVFEGQPGLARAHNIGLACALNPIVAFTDDDVIVDPAWLNRIGTVFENTSADCVTGLIYPSELETAAQDAVENLGYGKGYEVRSFNLREHRPDSPLFPYAAGAFGSGANMAFRTESLRTIGGFDPALGAGTPGVGGDDLAAFLDIITSGGTIVYEPAAIVYHFHDAGSKRLKRQAYGYGVGLGAYLSRAVAQRPTRLFEFARRAPQGVRHYAQAGPKTNGSRPPGGRALALRGLAGVLMGPKAYNRGRSVAMRQSPDNPDPG